jgi:hypothetical protein
MPGFNLKHTMHSLKTPRIPRDSTDGKEIPDRLPMRPALDEFKSVRSVESVAFYFRKWSYPCSGKRRRLFPGPAIHIFPAVEVISPISVALGNLRG